MHPDSATSVITIYQKRSWRLYGIRLDSNFCNCVMAMEQFRLAYGPHCRELSATARSWRSPLRNSSTIAPGAALPAMTASPVRSTRAMSKTGTGSATGKWDTASAPTASASGSAVASAGDPSSRAPDAGCETAGADCDTHFKRRLAPYVRDAEDKCCTTCCNKRERRHDYSAYRRHSKHPRSTAVSTHW
jgi:hypothetical protein